MGATQPRRAVIDRAWRTIGSGVEVLSGEDGAPLRRTVKRIIDPLVLRLRSNTQFSSAVLDPDTAAHMHAEIVGAAPRLRATAAWFTLLKQERRHQRITTGNAQELYFPACFELAVVRGMPGPDANAVARQTLADIHGGRDRTAVEVLNRHVTDPHVVRQLQRQLQRSWADVVASGAITGPFFSGLTTVLGLADTHNAEAARQRVWSALIADATPYNLGALARRPGADLPWSLTEIGLCSEVPQQPPPIEPADGKDRPLDRSVVDRVRATLRRALDRDELPDVPLLCAEEVDRACAPWGLLAEDNQAALLAGIEVATELRPLADSTPTRYHVSSRIQTRLAKEAYVLRARRYLAGDGPIHPRQQQVIDELGAFARPYVSRLWARLHGRDVWQESCRDVDDLRALLEGVARSVSLDHRQRIKSMLEVQVAG
ncbi:hypothetical protein KL953_31105 [Mycolicibacterium goodii]|nr:hypothetical protein [Mycolicibacterium goodii]MBU8813329.1 hypothetical protein [Mycolicibacterium goodii]MBU8817875.1 hypothetical protein [Mycolicibacterium goodii]